MFKNRLRYVTTETDVTNRKVRTNDSWNRPVVVALTTALICAGAALSVGMFVHTRPVRADAPPLAISKSASPDPVVAGAELTYLLTITNAKQTALSEVVVSDVIPANTTFVSAGYFDGNWGVWVPAKGEAGTVRWEAQAPLPGQQAMRLQLVVLVAPAYQGIVVNDSYEARAGDADPVVSQPVTVRAVQPTPTPTPTPTFTPTPTATPPATATSTPTAAAVSGTAPAPSPPPSPPPPPPSPGLIWPTIGFVVGGIAVAVFALWRLPRRSCARV